MKTYNTPYGDVFIDTNSKQNVIALSGGFDSAVLLYCLAKTLNDKFSDAVIYPFTVQRGNPTDLKKYDRVHIIPYVRSIIKYVREKFPRVTIKDSVIEVANYHWVAENVNGANISSYTKSQDTALRYLMWRHKNQTFTISNDNFDNSITIYNGVTRNPPPGCIPDSEETHRDKLHPIQNSPGVATVYFESSRWVGKFSFDHNDHQTWRNADKRVVFWVADQEGVLDDMLNMTRSCEGGPVETENFTKVCGECWWCLEREWAHKNYMNLDIKHEE